MAASENERLRARIAELENQLKTRGFSSQLRSDEVAKLAGDGLSRKEIAARLGVTVTTVRSIAIKHGIKTNTKAETELSAREERHDEIVRLRGDGLSYVEIGRRLGVSAEVVRMQVNRHEVLVYDREKWIRELDVAKANLESEFSEFNAKMVLDLETLILMANDPSTRVRNFNEYRSRRDHYRWANDGQKFGVDAERAANLYADCKTADQALRKYIELHPGEIVFNPLKTLHLRRYT